jgi:nucleoside-diphosphate kinase
LCRYNPPPEYARKGNQMSNRTFTIIKPDSVRKGNFGKIISRLESEGFRIIGLKKVALGQRQAEGFYAVHRERPFFGSLVEYMTSGPVYVAALERDNAVTTLRQVMGATDPQKAEANTIRKEFGESIEQNAIHGSDSDENAKIEISYFFAESELV